MFHVNEKGLLPLTDDLGELLSSVQRRGNKDVIYKNDLDNHGRVEYWSYPKKDGLSLYGDCEDISLYKRKLLIESGVDSSALLLTICKDPKGNGHCVLCVCTDKKDVILCNNHETLVYPRTMDREGYMFLYRQKLGQPINVDWDILK